MDIDEITLGEIAEVEAWADAPISEMLENTPSATKLKIALAWILKRKIDPSFTIEDAKALKMSELSAFLESGQPKK